MGTTKPEGTFLERNKILTSKQDRTTVHHLNLLHANTIFVQSTKPRYGHGFTQVCLQSLSQHSSTAGNATFFQQLMFFVIKPLLPVSMPKQWIPQEVTLALAGNLSFRDATCYSRLYRWFPNRQPRSAMAEPNRGTKWIPSSGGDSNHATMDQRWGIKQQSISSKWNFIFDSEGNIPSSLEKSGNKLFMIPPLQTSIPDIPLPTE